MFSKPSEANPNKLVCRFNPPVNQGWELVKNTWWCGRFRPSDNLTAIEWLAWQKGLEESATERKLS
jgi:hypothetical protein